MPARQSTAVQKFVNLLGGTLLFIAIVNFIFFCVVALAIGGDAINGKVEGGRYYLSSKGKLTEVSARVWNYSRWHAISVWITHPLGIFGGAGLLALSKRLGGKRAR